MCNETNSVSQLDWKFSFGIIDYLIHILDDEIEVTKMSGEFHGDMTPGAAHVDDACLS